MALVEQNCANATCAPLCTDIGLGQGVATPGVRHAECVTCVGSQCELYDAAVAVTARSVSGLRSCHCSHLVGGAYRTLVALWQASAGAGDFVHGLGAFTQPPRGHGGCRPNHPPPPRHAHHSLSPDQAEVRQASVALLSAPRALQALGTGLRDGEAALAVAIHPFTHTSHSPIHSH